MHGMACHLTGGPDILDLRSAVNVGLDAAHGVVSYRPDGDHLGDGIDAQKLHADFADQRQALVDPLRAQVGQIEMDIVEAIGRRKTPAFDDFRHLRTGYDIAGRQLHHLGCVLLHEALALVVAQIAAFAAAAFGHQDAGWHQSRGVELQKLRIFQSHARRGRQWPVRRR